MNAARCPMMSVITVTWNLINAGRQDSFVAAMNCVQDQTADQLEHVVFDGLSDDGTGPFIADIVANLGAKSGAKPVRFHAATDRGLYDAMNQAVDLATGDYVLFLNSDDLLAGPDTIARAQAVLAQNDADFAYGATIETPTTGAASKERPADLAAVLQRMPFSHNSLFIRKSVFQALAGHSLDYDVASDYDLVLRLIAGGYTGVDLNIPISLYSSRGASSDGDKVAREYALSWVNFYNRMDGLPGQYQLSDCLDWYHRGNLPFSLCLALLRRSDVTGDLRRAAWHSTLKSARRLPQVWRKAKR